LKVQITAPTQVGAEDFELAVLRALALEFACRESRPREGKAFSMPPSWLIEAVWQDIQSRAEGLPPGLYAKLLEAGPPPKLEAFLRQRPEFMKPTARAIYRAQALGLLGALLASPDGKDGLRRLLVNLHSSKPDDPRALLAAFPALEKDPGQLVKLWTLSLARASSSGRSESLSAEETGRRLQAILNSIKAPAGVKLPEGLPAQGADLMPALAGESSGRYALARAASELEALELRAHPLWAPVVAEYKSVAAALSRKPRRDAGRRLQAAAELAKALDERMRGVADHLNWFEASRVSLPSGAFDPPPPPPSVPERTDPISAAVSAAEKGR
ncbi:MAG: hypothetical protein N2322_00670, partial [Terrimicrobiaceae bacterium]|nr:hypothetical protein [Terrimicrobiaceae bacterium]